MNKYNCIWDNDDLCDNPGNKSKECLCWQCDIADKCWSQQSMKKCAVIAVLQGGPLAPELEGTVTFHSVPGGTEVCVNVTGLPAYRPAKGNRPPIGPHGFHIHECGNCQVGNPEDPFTKAGSHWNPANQPHGNHAGDLPVLFSNHGRASMCFFTDKFKPKDVVGKAVIIHQGPDDYRTQPAGDAGKRLACGVIRREGR